MFSWLFAVPFLGTFLTVISPAVKGIVEGIVEWLSACWHGVKTSNYGTWTLLLTTAALVWYFTPCECTKAVAAEKPSISKSITSKASNPKDTFLDWFGH